MFSLRLTILLSFSGLCICHGGQEENNKAIFILKLIPWMDMCIIHIYMRSKYTLCKAP